MHSAALVMLSDLYSDQRNHGYQGPSRAVSHPRACTVGGGTFAVSQEGSRCVIAGKDVLRIIRVLDPWRSDETLPSRQLTSQSNPSLESGMRICTGPGGATIDAGPNLWTSSGLKMDSAPTDVVWGRGTFDNKIVTSARNGEIIYWDINKPGSKYETRIKEHTRAITKLAISPFLPYLIVSGSQDGYLRVWDLRSPPSSNMKVYHPTGIRALSLCPVPSNPLTVCTGLESGHIQRWDIRFKASPLERITLAHSHSILSMDWQLPSMRESGLGWLVTSGMDRCVKVWDLCLPPGTSIPVNANEREALLLNKRMGPRPFRTLHTAFPVRNVCWRPGYDCEVAVVSNNESESETVEVWDIRRGWIGKWALEGADGGITDIAFASSHTLWAQHANGTFAQHDLRESFRPLDAIPRVAMSWGAAGNLAFVANKQPAVEVPFDDVDPLKKSILQELRLRPKATSDPMYVPFQQTLGVHNVPLFDRSAFVRLAKSYVFEGDKLLACQTNAAIAGQVGQYRAAQTWHLLSSQLTDMREPSPAPSVTSAIVTSRAEAGRHNLSPATGSVASAASASEPLSRSNASHKSSILKLIETRPPPSSSNASDHGQSRHGQDTPPSSNSSSPGYRTGRLPLEARQWLNTPETSLHDSSSISPRSGASRRASTVLPVMPRAPRPLLRRASVSTPATGSGSPASGGTKSHKHAYIGEGALDDSDSSNDSDSSTSGSSREPSPTPELSRLKRSAKAVPSPLSKVVSRDDSPDGHLGGDERSLKEFDSDGSHSPQSTSSSGSSPRQRSSSWSPHHMLAKQESQSSIRTVTAPPSDPPSARLRPLPEEDSHAAVVLSSEGLSTRRPSPTPGLALGLSNMDEHRDSAHQPHAPPPTSRLSDMRKHEVRAAEVRLRDIVWRALRDAVEWFSEKGDVQMCALLALVAPVELGIGAGRAARFVEAYVDLLSRMQLHTAAAHVRKYTRYAAVQHVTQVHTTLYTSCGECRKPLRAGLLCSACSTLPTLCSVCHLPTRALLLHCAICGHGGHIACLRTFYLATPPTALPACVAAEDSSSATGSVSTGYLSLSEETETEEEESLSADAREARARMRVLGRACPAGCGHYCWASARPP